MEITRVKLEIYAPESCVDLMRDALNALGACHIGNYDCCTSVSRVAGAWRPLPGSDPFDGEVGVLCRGEECKIEVVCPAELAVRAVETVKRLHPYEEPVVHVLPLWDM